MKTLFASALFASAVVAGSLAATSPARAATSLAALQAGTQAGPHVELVRDGCGPERFRDRFGYCRPYGYRPLPPRCPPYTHPTPYGCRRD
jgi:hypothetical protein